MVQTHKKTRLIAGLLLNSILIIYQLLSVTLLEHIVKCCSVRIITSDDQVAVAHAGDGIADVI